MGSGAPKVFVSYSWDDQVWVHYLADKLKQDQVEVIIDVLQQSPSSDLPAFMECAVRDSDFVLVVCTADYKRKADNRLTETSGVGFEFRMIAASLWQGVDPQKFIPLLCKENWKEAAPTALLASEYISFRPGTDFSASYQKMLSPRTAPRLLRNYRRA